MGQGHDTRPRHVDLSNERGIRFGAQCVICSARYATPLQPLASDTSEREMREAKDEVRTAFLGAWHELEIECYRCGRSACPLCWDTDNRMCAECVAERGLTRSPFRGVGSSGPLADGRLQVVETGRYSDVARPAWLGDLLNSPVSGGNSAGKPGAGGADLVQPWMLAMTTTGDLAREAYPDAPYTPAHPGTMAVAQQTMRMPAPAMPEEPVPLAHMPTRPSLPSETAMVHIPSPEGAVTSTTVECPRCGTENYDFVTRCTVCQLQLIQICPLCEKLNPGQATRCESCGSPLNRPRGWSGVINQQRITATSLASDELRWGEAQAARTREEARLGGPSALGVSGDLAWQAAGYAPPAMVGSAASALSNPGRRRTEAPAFMSMQGAAPALRVTGGPSFQPSYQPSYGFDPGTEEPPASAASALAERLVSWALIALIAIILGSVVAAELSAQANDAVRAVAHIDIRQILQHFAHQLELILKRSSR